MLKTLIVEDNASFRQLLNEILCAQFPLMHVVEAEDVMEAMDKLEAVEPDLVFVDIRLPDGNGLDLTRSIKAQYFRTVIIVITAYDLPEYRQAAYQNGANHFISKNSTSEADVLTLVESIITRHDFH